MSSLTIQANSVNDLYLPDGRNLFLLSGIDACAQNVQQACLMRLGEDIYNISTGVDYFGTIFTPQQNYAAARKSIIDTILSVGDVISVDNLTIAITGNTFNFVAEIITTFGPTTVSLST
jgi:hypothetical protein